MLRPHLEYVQVKDAVLATGTVVPAGDGDGEVRETIRALHADGFDGFFSLEPHLSAAGPLGGFSGAELFATAHAAFTRLLDDEGIACGAEAATSAAAAVSRDDIDVVAICTPSWRHAELTVAALDTGKHVIVEKPVDVS